MDFTSKQFRAFLLVAQHRSFSRAAEALYITPSGLSVLIRELETQLGFRLFDRTTRHVGLTSYGNDLLGVVRQSLEKVDSTVSRIGRSAAEASLSLSIGAPPLIAANVLPEDFVVTGPTSEFKCSMSAERPSRDLSRKANWI